MRNDGEDDGDADADDSDIDDGRKQIVVEKNEQNEEKSESILMVTLFCESPVFGCWHICVTVTPVVHDAFRLVTLQKD